MSESSPETRDLGATFAEHPEVTSRLTTILSDLQPETAEERLVGALGPPSGPLCELLTRMPAIQETLPWERVLERLAAVASAQPVDVAPLGTLRFAEGRFWMAFEPRPPVHPNLREVGDADPARIDTLVKAFRIRPHTPDAEALAGADQHAPIYVRRFDPEQFSDEIVFLAHEGLAEHDIAPLDRGPWFQSLRDALHSPPWLYELREMVEQTAPVAGMRQMRARYRVQRGADRSQPGTVEMYAVYDGGFVSARVTHPKAPRDRRVLKRLRRYSRAGSESST